VSSDEEPPRWRVRGERTLYDSEWVQLVLVDVEPPDGPARSWR
jgi:hypothetical protein